MKIETISKAIILTPDNGYKYITNGQVFSKKVYLGKYDKQENWHDTNDEPQDDNINAENG